MRKILYVVIPIIAFSIIFVNAFFGHLIFTSETQEVLNKYSVYVHLLSEWKSDSKNIILDVTNSWYKSGKASMVNHVFDVFCLPQNVPRASFCLHKYPYISVFRGTCLCYAVV